MEESVEKKWRKSGETDGDREGWRETELAVLVRLDICVRT